MLFFSQSQQWLPIPDCTAPEYAIDTDYHIRDMTHRQQKRYAESIWDWFRKKEEP
jgi:hypothetical protein